ncbi:hypothetical protein Glove_13g181 [Diversispora epigaea]|uniref:Uncharacterized protein n=1 Tax=Diversispora epigaea TaxID=1348612 RepID=A0A397JMT3_9GLOM|nr:hypothetical protein Glove_13g181 [Diversispora epigaea]
MIKRSSYLLPTLKFVSIYQQINTNNSNTKITTKRWRRRKTKATIGFPITNNSNIIQKMVIFTVFQIVKLEKLPLGEKIFKAKLYFVILVAYNQNGQPKRSNFNTDTPCWKGPEGGMNEEINEDYE